MSDKMRVSAYDLWRVGAMTDADFLRHAESAQRDYFVVGHLATAAAIPAEVLTDEDWKKIETAHVRSVLRYGVTRLEEMKGCVGRGPATTVDDPPASPRGEAEQRAESDASVGRPIRSP